MLDQVFASLAVGFAEQFGAPFVAAVAVFPGTPTYDAGGSITTGAAPVRLDCNVQFDTPTEAMRAAEGFNETDARILVLSATLDAGATIEVATGANAGNWSLLSVTRDPAGIGYECRGRKFT